MKCSNARCGGGIVVGFGEEDENENENDGDFEMALTQKYVDFVNGEGHDEGCVWRGEASPEEFGLEWETVKVVGNGWVGVREDDVTGWEEVKERISKCEDENDNENENADNAEYSVEMMMGVMGWEVANKVANEGSREDGFIKAHCPTCGGSGFVKINTKGGKRIREEDKFDVVNGHKFYCAVVNGGWEKRVESLVKEKEKEKEKERGIRNDGGTAEDGVNENGVEVRIDAVSNAKRILSLLAA